MVRSHVEGARRRRHRHHRRRRRAARAAAVHGWSAKRRRTYSDRPWQDPATPIRRSRRCSRPRSAACRSLSRARPAPDLSTSSGPFDAFLASLGKTRADFTLASAYSQGSLKAAVGAWRVKGADPSLLLPGFKTAVQASSTTPLRSGRGDDRAAARSRASAIPASSRADRFMSCVRRRFAALRADARARPRRGGDREARQVARHDPAPDSDARILTARR